VSNSHSNFCITFIKNFNFI